MKICDNKNCMSEYIGMVGITVSILYYINDADGETFVFDQNNRDGVPTEVTIKEKYPHRGNSVLIFDGFQYHASSNPITSKQRININLTFEI